MTGLMQVFYNKQTHFQIGDNTNLFDWTYVTNVAKAHLLAADRLTNPRPDLAEAAQQEWVAGIERPDPAGGFDIMGEGESCS